MLAKIKQLFKTDAIEPRIYSIEQLDLPALRDRLQPEARGAESGADEMPAETDTALGKVELEIVQAVGEPRDKILKGYEEQIDTYNWRLMKVTEARHEVDLAAGQARNMFLQESSGWETRIQPETARLRECLRWRERFREDHGLYRPSIRFRAGGIRWLALAAVMVLVESILNGYLFSQKNEFGLVGGALVAFLVSVVNVGVSSLFGFYSRFFHHRNSILKLYGLLLILSWLAFVGAFNLAVAHFRDSLISLEDWNAAAERAVEIIATTPFNVESIESWALVAIGCLISTCAFLKGFYADDPYPGYGMVERECEKASLAYEDRHLMLIDALESTKEELTVDLRDTDEFVRECTTEALDALSGKASLTKQLERFLRSCDDGVQVLLAEYREANRVSRSTPEPKHFGTPYSFGAYENTREFEELRQNANREQNAISKIIGEAIEQISEEHKLAISNFPSGRAIANAVDSGDGVVRPPKQIDE